ncbi:hypothetical protein CRE_02070 [Caenorhabditis remanei]|uniref:Uncharacterized protein n=1 Tax=Caenorhabditis remanei TaxID=31234 RepID=E3LH60_CAERE|nr:hypothetical protein CRE_02070 [Caenorhabditis remanei]
MAVVQGKLFILVHVDKHRDVMGEICSKLVTDYGVPVSICDDIQKVCPKCLSTTESLKSEIVTVSTTTKSASQSSDEHHDEIIVSPKVFPQTVPQKNPPAPPAQQKTVPIAPRVAPLLLLPSSKGPPQQQRMAPIVQKVVIAPPVPKVAQIAPKLNPVPPKPVLNPPVLIKPTNGYQATVAQNGVVKRKESPVRSLPEVIPEKKIRIEETPKIKSEEIAFDDDDEDQDVVDTEEEAEFMKQMLMKALQSQQNDDYRRDSSDEGASNSSNLYDADDDDFKVGAWNPDLLTSFITSQPAIFSATAQESNRSPSSGSSSGTTGKRQVPPMLTVNGKTRRGRIVYTTHELNILEKYYEEDPNACADPKKRETMCKMLSIDYHRLKVWFQNRRRKDKVKSQEDVTISFNGYSP